jgi:hypothetical protein
MEFLYNEMSEVAHPLNRLCIEMNEVASHPSDYVLGAKTLHGRLERCAVGIVKFHPKGRFRTLGP